MPATKARAERVFLPLRPSGSGFYEMPALLGSKKVRATFSISRISQPCKFSKVENEVCSPRLLAHGEHSDLSPTKKPKSFILVGDKGLEPLTFSV